MNPLLLFRCFKTSENVDISFESVSWIAANACSMIGAIFQKIQGHFNTIKIFALNDKLRNILERNGFLSFLGYPRVPDYQHTTIQYQKLFPKDSRFFSEYIRDDLLSKEAMPSMSPMLKKKIM